MSNQLLDVVITKEKYEDLIKAEKVTRLLSRCMNLGGWQAETATERVIEMLMRELKLYPCDVDKLKPIPDYLYRRVEGQKPYNEISINMSVKEEN